MPLALTRSVRVMIVPLFSASSACKPRLPRRHVAIAKSINPLVLWLVLIMHLVSLPIQRSCPPPGGTPPTGTVSCGIVTRPERRPQGTEWPASDRRDAVASVPAERVRAHRGAAATRGPSGGVHLPRLRIGP